ncbi:MAG: hypothetical protein HY706_07550 [Candidatus Hydrogenedentes bacterium]|nr:hypothetical protein [Candidatus Hydrogenedentota bacterium]
MKDHITNEELSAYLDGQAAEAKSIERHLAECSDCAQRHGAYARMSASLHTLRGPEVHPAFATRVLATIRERDAAQPAWWLRFRLPLVAAAATLVVVLALPLFFSSTVVAPPDNTLTAVDREQLENEVQSRLAQLASADLPEVTGFAPEPTVEEFSADELLEGLAAQEWFPMIANEIESDEDLNSILLAMDELETEAFRQELMEYAQRG